MYIERYGKPVAFYSDKHTVFHVNKRSGVGGNGMTQYGRALHELGIEFMCANTPAAKGRVERAHGTLQDRSSTIRTDASRSVTKDATLSTESSTNSPTRIRAKS